MNNRVYKILSIICNTLFYLGCILIILGFIVLVVSIIRRYVFDIKFLSSTINIIGANMMGAAVCCIGIERCIEVFYFNYLPSKRKKN